MEFLESLKSIKIETPEFFNQLQMDGLESTLKSGIPTRKVEAYKYTSLENDLNHFEYKDTSLTSKFDLDSLKENGFYHLFFINGKLNEKSDKVDFEVLENSERSINIIKKNNKAHKNDFLYNLNLATTTNYLHFEIAKNKTIDKPVLIYHLNSDKITAEHFTYSVGINSEVKFLHIYLNQDDSTFGSVSHSINLGENAKFLNIQHQDYNHDSIFNCNISSQIAKNANFESFTTTIGAKKSRVNLHLELNGEGAEGTASGVYTLQDTQHSDIHSYISHNSPHTESHQLYKGIMNDKSRGVFTGLIKVQKDAQLINSNQLNRNLLLTKGAQANSCPQLEIFADDVKCSHGSTTGQLSDEELFYFKSRGIKEEKAKMMLARAFTYDVLLKIKDKNIREYLHNEITEKFESNIFGK